MSCQINLGFGGYRRLGLHRKSCLLFLSVVWHFERRTPSTSVVQRNAVPSAWYGGQEGQVKTIVIILFFCWSIFWFKFVFCYLLFVILHLVTNKKNLFFKIFFTNVFKRSNFFKLSQLFFFTRSHKCIFFPSLKPSSPHMFSQIVKKKKKKIPTRSQVINTWEKTIYFRLKNLITLKKKVLICSSGPPQYGGE